MNLDNFFTLSVGVQVALGFGYLAYITAYAGLRKHHEVQDAVFLTLAFGVAALVTFQTVAWVTETALLRLGVPNGLATVFSSVVAVVAALAVSLRAGMWWRKPGRARWHAYLKKNDVHREDGVYAAWDGLIQAGYEVAQVSVHLQNGRVLYLNERSKYLDAPWEGLYLGGDGSIVMIVEEEEIGEGEAMREEERKGIVREDGTRLTYLPAGEITRVNLRLKEPSLLR